MATPTVYRSIDASAPVLTGAVGDLVNLLDKCLVAGYGSKSAAGWTKPYTGTNTAVFRMATGGQRTGFYLDVNDNGPGAGGAKEARIRGYEQMTAVATGTDPFPTVAQNANGFFVRKSRTADAVARDWYVIATDRFFYCLIWTADNVHDALGFAFGDFYTFDSSDNYNCIIIGRTTENSAVNTEERLSQTTTNITGSVTGHRVARDRTGANKSPSTGKYAPTSAGVTTAFIGFLEYPDTLTGKVEAGRCFICDSSTLRGHLPGFVYSPHINRRVSGSSLSGSHIPSFSYSLGAEGTIYEGVTFQHVAYDEQGVTSDFATYCFEVSSWTEN
jgi:hypothetical protein